MPKRDSCENRKNKLDGARLNPKHWRNGSFAAYARIGYCSTTIPLEGSRLK